MRALFDASRRACHPLEEREGTARHEVLKKQTITVHHDVVLHRYRGIKQLRPARLPRDRLCASSTQQICSAKSFHAYFDRLHSSIGPPEGGRHRPRPATRWPPGSNGTEAARTALGSGPIDLVGGSAGSHTTMIFAWRGPGERPQSIIIRVSIRHHFLWSRRTLTPRSQRLPLSRRTPGQTEGQRLEPFRRPRCGGPQHGCGQVLAACRSTATPSTSPQFLQVDKVNLCRGGALHLDDDQLALAPLRRRTTPADSGSCRSSPGIAFPESFGLEQASPRSTGRHPRHRAFLSAEEAAPAPDSILGDSATNPFAARTAMRRPHRSEHQRDDVDRVCRDSKVNVADRADGLDFATPAVRCGRGAPAHLPTPRPVRLRAR